MIAAPATAQDEPKYALVASLPTPTVSLEWRLSQRLAIRFDGSYSHRDESTEYESTTAGSYTWFDTIETSRVTGRSRQRMETVAHTGSIGIAGIVALRRTNHLHLYVAPRVFLSLSRQRSTETITSDALPSVTHTYANGATSQVIFGLPTRTPSSTETSSSSTSPGAGISFGARSKVFQSLAVFGEAGLNYSRSDSPLATIPTLRTEIDSRRIAVGTRAVAGVMLLF
ncbi:MAG TPA: hypothetical protein VEA16_08270 [Vicinamibacterales bacterium]|nr:hypothetical protein [Vicinamibacterales bacterium]